MARFAYMPAQAAAQGISFIGRQSRDWRVTVARTSLDRLVYQMVFPYLSIYIVALGATATQLGAINSAGMVAAAILGPSTGWLIDRIGTKRVYLAGIGMLIVSYMAYSLAQSWPMALVAMVGYWRGRVGDWRGGFLVRRCPRISLQALPPETKPRFQPPLINPDMRFSLIRLSEILHRVAIGAALCHDTVPAS